MSSKKDVPTQLQVLPIILSALHLPLGISALHLQSGIEVSLPKSETAAPTSFKAIVSESTNMNLLLKSFYDSNVSGKVFDKTRYEISSLADNGISRCAFTTTFGMMRGEPALNDKTAPQFKVNGTSRVPFMHQGYFFSPTFLICDHIFCRREYETQFAAVLSLDFLQEYFIRAQSNGKGWTIQLPPFPSTQSSELPVYTDGCCLSNGLAAGDPEAKPARGGYGIHFPTLPSGWDMYGALAPSDSHTNQKAELIAIIRALQLVRLRKIPCVKISVFTDSKYAVQALNEWIPHIWRSNGYRTAKKRAVVNEVLFRSLDEEVSFSIKSGIPVKLSHVPREQNQKADALSKMGAASIEPSMMFSLPDKDSSNNGAKAKETGGLGKGSTKEASSKVTGKWEGGKQRAETKGSGSDVEYGRPQMILGRNLFEEMRPMVQWSPDGIYWAEWQSMSGPDKNLESNMKFSVV